MEVKREERYMRRGVVLKAEEKKREKENRGERKRRRG